ncbi:hypothetical protein [Endozoicomonas sp. GU-1]|uniref:hypothetical protein n=1 Tax=Endozoicomonas sp. GU-1 TaxID=3009078 RepID=UPI0022B4C9EB|nr:hypothetical protein [Endozoicomonas sp. GU-1]WBA82479.1 hypothetical protein O2T12_04845 [Endozoicomonas sp. GU-1]WBA85412.1 hypothetical protein O3276_19515 [Endozoicomonas sp. GU-1]
MNIETAGTETDRVIDALPASYFREAITGRLSVQNGLVQNGLPEEDEFQAILQQMIEPLGPINPEGASNPSLHSDLPSTIYTNTTDVGEDIQAIEWATTTDAEVPAVHPLPELKLNSQHLPSDQLTRRPNPVEMGPVKPDHSGEEASGQTVLPDVQQTMEIGSLRQSAQLSMAPTQKRTLSNQEALAPESTPESPADQESQTTTQPVTAEVSDTPLKRLEPASVRQPSPGNQSSAIQPVTAPVQNCLMLGGDRYARAVAEFPGLGTVQVVMTRHNSEVTVNLQASQQSLPTLESCSSTLHQLVSDSIQQMHTPGNSVNKEPGGSSATESGLKIALSLTTPDHSGSGRERQHPLAEELAGVSYFSGTDADLVALAPPTPQSYRLTALSQHSVVALIDLHI